MAKDLQTIVDGIAMTACVMSVETLEGGDYGSIRIVTGNPAYVESIEKPVVDAPFMPPRTFVPNCEYTEYFPPDLNFEDSCYQAAVNKKYLHSYARPERSPVWFDMTFIPLNAEDENTCYCIYSVEATLAPDSQRLSDVPGAVASNVLEMAITLRSGVDFKKAMFDVTADNRELCKAEYCGIMLVDEGARTCSMLAESIAEGSSLLPMQTILDNVDFYDIARSWDDTIAGSNCLIAKNRHDMTVVKERNPAWYESLMQSGIESIVMFPLKSHDELLGYIWAVNFDSEESVFIKEALELTTYVLAAELDNYLLVNRLKILSSKDMLTGVLNRNEMNNLVSSLGNGEAGAGESIGVVFADLNGLKTVNDREGHAAGDRLLVNATEALLEVFEPQSIFRAGGDEFVVIESGVSEDDLDAKVEAVRQAEKRYDGVSFSLGSCVGDDGADIRDALRIADARMYEDKAAYYGRA